MKNNIFIIVILLSFSMNVFARYNRKDYKHWSDLDHDCQNTRAEILIRDNIGTLAFSNYKQCTVKTGVWNDFYYDETIAVANQIDIDHVVPLKYANDIGAESWSPGLKERFANDPLNLISTNKKYNRQKGSKSITEWLPVNRIYACKYVKRWFAVKEKYRLLVSEEELSTFKLLKCI